MIGGDDDEGGGGGGGGGSGSGSVGRGGKVRKRRSRTSAAKPYDRPQSVLNRVGNVLRGFFNPSTWIPNLNPNEFQEEDEDEGDQELVTGNASGDVGRPIIASSRSALNSSSLESSSITTSTNNGLNFTRHRNSMLDNVDNETAPIWNNKEDEDTHSRRHRLRSNSNVTDPQFNSATRASTSFASDFDDDAVASTSISFASPNPVTSRTNFTERTNQRKQSSRNTYARLCDIGNKLPNNLSSRTSKNDSQSECSEESVSTSGCSSMVPHPDKRDYQHDVLQMSQPALRQLSVNLRASLQANDETGRQSSSCHDQLDESGTDFVHNSRLQDRLSLNSSSFLFSESLDNNSKPQPAPTTKRPQFNPFLFGSPTIDKSSTRGSTRFDDFNYSRVSYGFGSSGNVSRLNSTAPYSTSCRRSIQVKSLQTGDMDLMSSTTKRILETLEKMSTPVMDAKRIPTLKPDPILDSPLTFTTTPYRRRPNLSMKPSSNVARIESNSSSAIRGGPPINKLMTPGSIASTRTYIRNVGVSTTQVRNEANSSSDLSPLINVAKQPSKSQELSSIKANASFSSSSRGGPSGGGGGKIRIPRQNADHYSRNIVDDEIPHAPKLHSVPLNIDALPKFNFHNSNNNNNNVMSTSFGNCNERAEFKFSSPVASTVDIQDKQVVSKFTFSSPLSVAEHDAINNVNMDSSKKDEESPKVTMDTPNLVNSRSIVSGSTSASITFKAPSVTKQVLKEKPVVECDGDQLNELDPVGGFAVATELMTGSVMDVLMKPKTVTSGEDAVDRKEVPENNKDNTSKSDFGDKFKPAAGSWECPSCMLRNNNDSNKCVACETMKITAVNDSSKVVSTFVGFGDKFKPAVGSWECPGCMLRIDKDKVKCDSCETSKPGTKATTSLSSKVASDTWLCDTCLVRNSLNFSRCAACEVPRPGSQITTAPGSFKFGIPATVNSTTTTVTQSPLMNIFSSTSLASTTSTTTTTTSTFKFGLPTSSTTVGFKSESESIRPTITIDSNAQGTFKFGFQDGVSASNKAIETESSVTFKMPSAIPIEKSSINESSEGSSKNASGTESSFFTKPKPEDAPQSNSLTSVTFSSSAKHPSPVRVPSSGLNVHDVVVVSSSSIISNNDSSLKSSFSFGCPKPITEDSTPAVKPNTLFGTATASSTTLPLSSTVFGGGGGGGGSCSQPVGGLNFKFNSVDSKSTVASTSTALPVFSFGKSQSSESADLNNTKDSTTSTNFQSAKGGFPFSFGAAPVPPATLGTKRSATDSDGSDSAKKIVVSSSGFGSFGPSGTQAATNPTKFSFGTTSPIRPQPSSGPIFGALSTTIEKSPSSNTFTFGANTSSVSGNTLAVTSNSNLLPFCQSVTTKAASVQLMPSQVSVTQTQSSSSPFNFKRSEMSSTTAAPSTFPSFSFGSQANNNNNNIAPAFGGSISSAAPIVPPTFGTASQPSGLIFGSQSSLVGSATSSSTFGSFGAPSNSSTVTPVFGSNTGMHGTTGFSFGSTAATAAAPAPRTIRFGGPASQESGVFTFTGNQNPVVNFGQQQQHPPPPPPPSSSSHAAPSTGFNFNPANQLNFNFSGGTPGTANQPPVFSAQQNPFDALASGGNRAVRQIKKAKRRTQK